MIQITFNYFMGLATILGAVSAPTITAIWAEKKRARDAHNAAELARLVAMKVAEVKNTLMVTSEKSDKKLDVIHGLVNSQLTEAVARLDAALKEIAAIKARHDDENLDEGKF
jgi:septal ring factor EnvC (AmiA/AmiB activator)